LFVNELSRDERVDLARCEARPLMTPDEARACWDGIKADIRGLRARLIDFYEREGWKALGYSSWRECVASECGRSQSYLYRQLEAARIEREISPVGEIGRIPEGPLRELAGKDKTPDGRRAAWARAISTAPDGKPTAQLVRRAVDELSPKGESPDAGSTLPDRPEPDASRATSIGGPAANCRVIRGDARQVSTTLPAGSIHLAITSPPFYRLRQYGTPPQTWGDGWVGELGQEPTPGRFVDHLVEVFDAVRPALRVDATLWVNLGDSYHNKSLVGTPWMFAFAMKEAGWILRSAIPWIKRNTMPSSVEDRPGVSHEWWFGFAKSTRYFWDVTATRMPQATIGRRHEGKSGYRDGHPSKGGVKERQLHPDGKARRTGDWFFDSLAVEVDAAREYLEHLERIQAGGQGLLSAPGGDPMALVVNVTSNKEAHYASYPEKLVEPLIRAGTSEYGACVACGTPWARVVAKTRVATRPGRNSKVYKDPEGSPYKSHSGVIVGNRDTRRHCTVVHTTGWEPGCACGTVDVEPCVILDPFLGSGTTARVAIRLNRSCIGVELKDDYVDIARRRIAGR
jgi:site-specific DNA-methyltransferase (adenine-specific)